jgi:hypothetical protein
LTIASALHSRANFESFIARNHPRSSAFNLFPQDFERSLVEWEPAVGWPLQNGMWEGRGDVQVIQTLMQCHQRKCF